MQPPIAKFSAFALALAISLHIIGAVITACSGNVASYSGAQGL